MKTDFYKVMSVKQICVKKYFCLQNSSQLESVDASLSAITALSLCGQVYRYCSSSHCSSASSLSLKRLKLCPVAQTSGIDYPLRSQSLWGLGLCCVGLGSRLTWTTSRSEGFTVLGILFNPSPVPFFPTILPLSHLECCVRRTGVWIPRRLLLLQPHYSGGHLFTNRDTLGNN